MKATQEMRARTAVWLMGRDQTIKSALSCDRGIRLVLCSVRCSHTGVGLDPSYPSSRFREWLRSAFFPTKWAGVRYRQLARRVWIAVFFFFQGSAAIFC